MEKILSVTKGSPAAKVGIKVGDYLVGFDGREYTDVLDFCFYDAATEFSVQTKDGDGALHNFSIRKRSYTPIGIELTDAGFDIRPCRNNCVFCFVAQCPKGMRETLYVKDDDYRLSFTCGSYITLTNLSEEDVERIIRLKLSPLYVSVHAYDKATKVKLCANPRSADTFELLRRFADNGIVTHTQIVMVEGYNDGEVLEETVSELYKLYPMVKSVAVVPVGLTGHREGLTPLQPVSKEAAARTVRFTESFNEQAADNAPEGFVWSSDEMYILAERELPPYSYYGNFDQIENGVGLVAEFLSEVTDELNYHVQLQGEFTLVTGRSFYPTLKRTADLLTEIYDVKLDVIAVDNDFFGRSVTVAGLLTGGDVIRALKDKLKYRNVILPHNVFKEFENVMLDGVSAEDIEKELSCKVHISRGGDGLIKILAGDYNE